MISLSQAFKNWTDEVKPAVIAQYGTDDRPALSESWNDYTDALCKDGELCALQYHYAPAFDDEMPGDGSRFDPLSDDREFILDAMGLTMSATRAETRPNANEWGRNASHWRVTLRCNGKRRTIPYSMGAAHTGAPEICDVLNAVLRDAEAGAESFDDFCRDLGYDVDSRKAHQTWKACKRAAASLDRLLSGDAERIREMFADY